MNKTPRTCCLCKEPYYPVTKLEKTTNTCNRCLWLRKTSLEPTETSKNTTREKT